MQTLGLSSKPQPADNIFKRLFWPTIESGYDVDLLGQQGFWLCTGIAALTGFGLLVAGWPTLAAIFVLAFFLGGCGVRERSIVAAAIIFFLYTMNVVSGFFAGGVGNPLIVLIVFMLLLSNIRATVLSRMWSERPEQRELEELPERGRGSIAERFANVLPQKIWPIGQYIFYPMAVIVLVLLIVGAYAGQRRRTQVRQQEQDRSVTVEVSPAAK